MILGVQKMGGASQIKRSAPRRTHGGRTREKVGVRKSKLRRIRHGDRKMPGVSLLKTEDGVTTTHGVETKEGVGTRKTTPNKTIHGDRTVHGASLLQVRRMAGATTDGASSRQVKMGWVGAGTHRIR